MTAFPSLSPIGERRQARLLDGRLQAIVGTRRREGDLEVFLGEILRATVDICRLRDDAASEDELRRASDVFRRACDRAGALFVVDGLPGLAVQVGADGVHVGPADVHADHARRVVGPDLLVGRTVRTPREVDASADEDLDYLVVGTLAGLSLVGYAARRASHPWYAWGGVAPATVGSILEAGAERVVVDEGLEAELAPAQVCWALRRALSAKRLS